jgi:hypothetical protein
LNTRATHPGVSGRAAPDPSSPQPPILSEAQVSRRMILLAELQAALETLGIGCVLARRHRLVLRYNDPPPLAPSGPVSPTLHIFTPGGTRTAGTDGTTYRLDDGREFPVADAAAAATSICRALKPAARA